MTSKTRRYSYGLWTNKAGYQYRIGHPLRRLLLLVGSIGLYDCDSRIALLLESSSRYTMQRLVASSVAFCRTGPSGLARPARQ